jgi:hypothetical protein
MSIKMSFFAMPPYISYRSGHLKRGSSMIRAQQMAEYLGAKYNPVEGYEDDVCIYVKPTADIYASIGSGKRNYVDILDSGHIEIDWLKEHPGVNVIAASRSAYDYLLNVLGRTNVVLIPQHHCNFERNRSRRGDHFVAGYIASPRELSMFFEDINAACGSAGVELKVLSLYKDRLDVANFYQEIDLQIIWRSQKIQVKPLKNALKLANGGSFGIPTVALAEVGYQEYEGYYVPVNSFEELANAVKKFRENSSLYEQYASQNLEKAESYHIDHIAKKYLELLKVKP